MDKKTIIGLVLMVAVFVGFSFYQGHQAEEYNKWKKEQAEVELALKQKQAEERKAEEAKEAAMTEEERQQRDSLEAARRLNAELYTYGEQLLAARNAEAKICTIENEVLKVDFATRGGKIENVTLKNYTRYSDGERTELVEMLQPATARFDMALKTESGAKSSTAEYVFDYAVEEGEESTTLKMTLAVSADAYLRYIYTIYETGNPSRDYLIDFTVEEHNMSKYLDRANAMDIAWGNRSNMNERSFQMENMATTIAYWESEDDEMEDLAQDGDMEKVDGVDWIALKQQYFTSAFISAEPVNAAMAFSTSTAEGKDFLKEFDTVISIPVTGAEAYRFAFYYGPNDFKILNNVEFDGEKTNLDEIIPMGGTLIGWINRIFTIPIFHWLKDHGVNFGIIILILTILVKLIILPLTYKSYMSTAKMRAVRPELEELNKKYPNPDDAMKKQQATMELYQKAGISPMGGCLPMLIQMPILWAMFRFFPASIELRGQSFLWVKDLSSYDSVLDLPFNIPFYGDHVSLFALLMTVALFGYSFITYKQQSAATAGQPGAGMMKFMMVYFLPVMMLFFFNSYSSGLCYYYFLSQMFTMVIMWAIRRSVDDEKVRAKLLAAKAKPKKKSKFQERYEEALRQQQEQMNREQRRQRR